MSELPLHILTDAGFTEAESRSIVDHLIQGTDAHAPSGPERIDVEGLPPGQREAYERFVEATTADA